MESAQRSSPGQEPSMEFVFHSVVSADGHTKYYNIYRIDEEHYLAQCHHFNRERLCDGDFELHRQGDHWAPVNSSFEEEAQQIGEEIDRMYGEGRNNGEATNS